MTGKATSGLKQVKLQISLSMTDKNKILQGLARANREKLNNQKYG
jgi:hypothetical protein